jgi:hypothetical protein
MGLHPWFLFTSFFFFFIYIVLLLYPSSFAIKILPMGFFGVIYSQKVREKMVLQNAMKIFFLKLPKKPLCVNINVPKKKWH